MSIPISRPIIGDEERAAVDEVMRSGMLASGPKVVEFEEAFAAFVGVQHAIAVGSGTAALHVGLLAAGVGPGDEVIVPSFTFAATANSVAMAGATPVFIEIDPVTFCIDAESARSAITERTVGIMPVHLYGHPAPLDDLSNLARDAGVDLYEDAAQAHGASWMGQTVGSVGRFSAFSFYPTKNMTTGEGGMITTNDGELAERARWIRNQGMSQRYQHEVIGLNERMTSIEAAIGLVQLAKLPAWTEARRSNASMYRELLHPDLGLPAEPANGVHVYHQFTIRPPDRGRVMEALDDHGIGYGVYYPKGTHLQPPYVETAPSLPITDEICDKVVSIPVRPDLRTSEISAIARVLNEVVS